MNLFLSTRHIPTSLPPRRQQPSCEKKLAACVNIHGPIKGIYAWEGRIENGTEFAAFIKTRRALADEVIARSRPLHPYSVPCFLVLPIETGNDDYLAWAREQTEQGA